MGILNGTALCTFVPIATFVPPVTNPRLAYMVQVSFALLELVMLKSLLSDSLQAD